MPQRCSTCGRRTGETSVGRDVCRACTYESLLPRLREVDIPAAPVGERYAALVDVAPVWVVARFVGADKRIVRRQALLYTSAAERQRAQEQDKPHRQYRRRCGQCGAEGHLSPTCPELRPDRNDE